MVIFTYFLIEIFTQPMFFFTTASINSYIFKHGPLYNAQKQVDLINIVPGIYETTTSSSYIIEPNKIFNTQNDFIHQDTYLVIV